MNENENPYISMVIPRKEYLNNLYENKRGLITIIIAVFFVLFYAFFLNAPKNFPVGSIYDLKYGETLSGVSEKFKDIGVIQSEFWFKSFIYLFSLGDEKVIAGDYLLYKKQNVLTLAWRVSRGKLDIVPVRITIPEGVNSYEIADIITNNFPSFDKKVFLSIIEKQKLEGYLFPDTYFFVPDIKEEDIVKIMTDNFNAKINDLRLDIEKFGKSLSDVIKMASIVEEEARTLESREIVAGILWKRISIGMALQVDSSFKYINGKTTATLTIEDLKIDSPYNSYTKRGLPPTPISNPGLEAIKATIYPIKTGYFYFLTGNDGNMYYATTFDEHVENKFKYLK